MTDIIARLAEAREQFEKWSKWMGCAPERDGDGYAWYDVDFAWRAWQAALAAYESERVGWQPIETAPKDGTDVLVSGGTYNAGLHSGIPLHGVIIAFWDASHWHGPEANAHDEWWECFPTHWMPLPAAPVQP